MLVTTQCASYCRYCTRSRIVGDPGQTFNRQEFEMQIEYLKRTPQVRDVLLSGGDPLVLAPKVLEELLGRLREIPHIEIIRLGSRGVILDATFLDLDQRAQAEAVAAASGLPFQGLWLQAEEAVLEARIGARSDDASDATAVVLERQRARDPGAGSWTAIDAAGAPAAVAAAAFAALSPGG
jgi:hypothetical protein